MDKGCQWHHYVVVAKDRTIAGRSAMYIDGELKAVDHLDGQRVACIGKLHRGAHYTSGICPVARTICFGPITP